MNAPSLLPETLLAGRVVFVSGGGSGVNLAIAGECARVGAAVAICGRTESRLAAAAEQLTGLGAAVSYTVADVRDAAAVRAAFERTERELGPVDAVVCGAAGNFLAPAESISSNGFRAVVDIDLLGAFHCVSAAFDQLRRTRGAVLFVSGGPSTLAFAQQAHVAAAKAGVDQLMRSLAVEWAHLGIRANSIVPGPVAGTEGMSRLASSTGDGLWTELVPLGRMADGAEIGAMAVVLLSPLAAYVTGAQVFVDGGMNLNGAGRFNAALRELAADGL